MCRRNLGLIALTAIALPLAACGGDDESGSIEEWCALGPVLVEVSDVMTVADFNEPAELEEAMSVLTDAVEEVEDAAPEEIEELVQVFAAGNRAFATQFEEVGYDVAQVDGAAVARAIEDYTAPAVEIDEFTAAECDEPFLLFDQPVTDPGSTSGETTEPPSAGTSSTAGFELLDAGAEEGRVRLDVPPELGDTWEGEMLVRVELTLNGVLEDTPTSIVDLGMEVVDVTDDGSVTIASEVTGVRTYRRENYSDQLLAEYEPRAETMVGTTSTWTLDVDGEVVDLSTELPDDIDATIAGGIQVGDQAATQMTTPVPDEPVGVGARWVTTQVTDIGGVQATLTTEYELQDLDEDVFLLATTLEQTISVADGVAEGNGSIRQRISGLAPSESISSSDGTFVVEEENGERTELRMTTSASITES